MVLMTGCIVLSTISFETEEVQVGPNAEPLVEKLSVFYPVFFALLSSFFFTWNQVLTKAFTRERREGVFQWTIDSFLLVGILATIMLFYEQSVQAYTFNEVSIQMTSGFLACIAQFLNNICVMYGRAGPSVAIIQMKPSFQLALEVLIYSRIPFPHQLVGMALGVIGSIVIAVAKKA
jgi:uncharacterized membrane protein